MKRVSKIKSNQLADLIELKRDASELLDAIKSACYIERKLQDELTAFNGSGDAIDYLERKRRTLLRRPLVRTSQLTAIEEDIDASKQLLAIAQVQVGKFSRSQTEIERTIADLRTKIANNNKSR